MPLHDALEQSARATTPSPAVVSPMTAALEMFDVTPHNAWPRDVEENTPGPLPEWLTLIPRASFEEFVRLTFRPLPKPACVSVATSFVEPALLWLSWSGTATPSVALPDVAPPVS